MNIDSVFKLVTFISNKEQSGVISPSEFNLLAERAQMQVFREDYGLPEEYQVSHPIPKKAFQITQNITDDLMIFIFKTNLFLKKDGTVNLPGDYIHYTSIRHSVFDKDKKTKEIDVQVIDDDKIGYVLNSSIVAPTIKDAVCSFYGRKSNGTSEKYLEIFPKEIQKLIFTYLRKPVTPKWAFSIVNGRPVYNPGDSVDFEYPDIEHNRIVIRILSFVGINLREGQLQQYTQTKEVQGV